MMHPFRTSLVIPAVAVGIALLGGCGGLPTASAPEAAGAPPAAASVQDAPVASDTVAIQNFTFSPAIVTVKAGTTVTWTNRDQDPHTATAMSGPFHSPTLTNGESYHYTFTMPGRFEYLCTVHPFMTATVVVTP
jgi:plastocyanin